VSPKTTLREFREHETQNKVAARAGVTQSTGVGLVGRQTPSIGITWLGRSFLNQVNGGRFSIHQ
jgi:hypothetical protein